MQSLKFKNQNPESSLKRQIPGILEIPGIFHRTDSPRFGLTLIELMFGMLIASILMTGIGSAIYIALQCLSETSKPSSPVADTAEALDQIHGEMNHALRFTERTNTAVTFTVPDRDGNSIPESIRFAWSGTAGDPLTRSYNGSTPLPIAENVHYFDMSALQRDMRGTQSPSLVEQTSTEGEHISHNDAPGGTFKDHKLDGSNQCAQYFQVRLPANTVSWSLTQFHVQIRQGSANDGLLTVQIRTADANKKPGPTVLSEVTITENTLTTEFSWKQILLSPIDNLTPGQGLCVVFIDSGPGNSGHVQYEQLGTPMTAYTHWMTSGDNGVTWSSPNDTEDMRFIVTGTYTTEEVPLEQQ